MIPWNCLYNIVNPFPAIIKKEKKKSTFAFEVIDKIPSACQELQDTLRDV
jgi:hypothetical protein